MSVMSMFVEPISPEIVAYWLDELEHVGLQQMELNH